MALFSLVAVFTATVAWFSANHRANSKGMNVAAKEDNGRLNRIDVYELEAAQYQKEGYYVFKKDPSSTIFGGGTANLVNLGEYEYLNPDHPVLLIFALNGQFTSTKTKDFYIKGITTSSGYLCRTKKDGTPFYTLGQAPEEDPNAASSSSEPTSMAISASSADVSYNPDDDEDLVHYLCRGTKEVGGTYVDCYPLSSVINFKCTQYASESDFKKTDPTTNKTTIDISKNAITLRDAFVNFSGTGSGSSFTKEPYIYYTTGNESFTYVAMVINYDPDVIAAIYSTYLGNDILEGEIAEGGYGGRFYFTCDFSLEVA